MDSEDLINSAKENLKDKVSIKSIYGEPITEHGRTIIPVAKIMHCFGGRFDALASKKEDDNDETEGGNRGCGCIKACPTGVIEITEEDLRYINFDSPKKFAMALGVGMCMGMMMSKKKYMKHKHMHKWHKDMSPIGEE